MAGMMVLVMVAPAMSEDASTSATVGNAPPSVCAKWEEPDDQPETPATTEVMPNPNPDVKTVTIYACVHDDNGNDDIANVTAAVTGPGATPPTWSVTLNPDAGVSCDAGCTGYSGTFDMGSCDPAGTYTVVVTVTDKAGDSGTEENTFEYLSLIAMTAGDVAFGSVAPGGSSNASSTITVYGNDAIKFDDLVPAGYDDPDPNDGIVWSDMTSAGNTIADDQITTTWVPATCITGCLGAADVPFTLNVPAGTPPGTYGGTITFTPSHC